MDRLGDRKGRAGSEVASALLVVALTVACVPHPGAAPHPTGAGADSAWARGLQDGIYDAGRHGTGGGDGMVGFASGFGMLFGSIYAAYAHDTGGAGWSVAVPVVSLAALVTAASSARPANVVVPDEVLADARARGPEYAEAWETAYRKESTRLRRRALGVGHAAGLLFALVVTSWIAVHPYT